MARLEDAAVTITAEAQKEYFEITLSYCRGTTNRLQDGKEANFVLLSKTS